MTRLKKSFKLVKWPAIILMFIFYNHFVHFYLTMFFCIKMPEIPESNIENLDDTSTNIYKSPDESLIVIPRNRNGPKGSKFNIQTNTSKTTENFLFISDIHILGPKNSILDRLWHETHMNIHYKSINYILNLSQNWKNKNYSKFILGDIFDYGMFYSITDSKSNEYWKTRFRNTKNAEERQKFSQIMQSYTDFQHDLKTFYSIFSDAHVILGNHDVAFPMNTNTFRIERMNQVFGRRLTCELLFAEKNSAVPFSVLNSSGFSKLSKEKEIYRNSMACLENLSKILQNPNPKIMTKNSIYSSIINGTIPETQNTQQLRPILLQHFPLWRQNDEICRSDLPDSAKNNERHSSNSPSREALDQNISKIILEKLKPELILSGHTHNGCYREHKIQIKTENENENNKKYDLTIPEISVASFNYRNRDNPVFMLMTISENYIVISKNLVGRQSSIIVRYLVFFLVIIIRVFYRKFERTKKNHKQY